MPEGPKGAQSKVFQIDEAKLQEMLEAAVQKGAQGAMDLISTQREAIGILQDRVKQVEEDKVQLQKALEEKVVPEIKVPPETRKETVTMEMKLQALKARLGDNSAGKALLLALARGDIKPVAKVDLEGLEELLTIGQ